MADFSRPKEGFRFTWGGMSLSSQPDALPPNKYASAFNVRSVSGNSLRTRPGYSLKFATGLNPVTDIKAYATLGTDDLPRFLARDTANGIYLDTGSQKVILSGSAGYGVSMVPFRPGASSQSWMYVASIGDYKKLSAPDGSGNVTVQKVGIAEPQTQLEAATNAPSVTSFNAVAASWTAGGTAGSPSDSNLFTDTVGAAVLADPVVSSRISVQVSITYYSPGMLVKFGSSSYPIEEVWPACATCTITAIRYDSGSSGMCSVVPSVDLSSTIGRGSIVKLNTESVLVLSVTAGTNGTCVFRCSTSGTHSASETITGVLAVVVHGSTSTSTAITFPDVNSAITSGVATLSQNLSAGIFSPYSVDDYIYATLLISDIANTTSVSFIFNVSNTVNYTTSILTYTVQGAALAPLLLAGEVVVVSFPISALSTVPGALNPCNGFRLQVVGSSSQTISIGGLWVGGGSLPDVGDSGAPYMFRAVPRSSLTGAKGNSTPPMRYGVTPRRQSVTVTVPSAAYDTQIDTWDYYAIGGSVTQYGYVGSTAAGAASFTFNYFDDTIAAAIANGNTLPTQAFEPWPSIDVSWSVASGGGTTITAVGTYITVSGPSSWPATILRWLPGTIVTLAGFQSFTLRTRPTQLSSTSYLFNVQEALGSQSPTGISVAEPIVANQILPYVWGPDAYGVVFGCGDPLRPGTLYFTTAYAPDQAPQTNTLELSPPDKPLIGGCIKGGVSLTNSTNKWWALYPNPSGTGSYTAVEWPVGRVPVCPYTVTDGVYVYFWARDGICRTAQGPYESLTDDDLYVLFPHEGVQGSDVSRVGSMIYAPDYSKAAQFRLGLFNNFLFADYLDSGSNRRTLVCDLRFKAWCVDDYADHISVHYGVEQQSSSLVSSPTLYSTVLLGDSAGKVYTQTDLHNDNATFIGPILQTFEYDGGDMRAFEQWGDLYLDCIPASALLVAQPVSLNATAGSSVSLPTGTARIFKPISIGGAKALNTLGMYLSWSDDFSVQSVPTQLFLWQPSFVPKPELIVDRFGDWAGSLMGD